MRLAKSSIRRHWSPVRSASTCSARSLCSSASLSLSGTATPGGRVSAGRLVDHAFGGVEQGMLGRGELVLDAKRAVADAPEAFAGGEFGQGRFLGAGQAEMRGGGSE